VLEDTEKENRNDCGQMKGLEYFWPLARIKRERCYKIKEKKDLILATEIIIK
jgi:hypothetical protein